MQCQLRQVGAHRTYLVSAIAFSSWNLATLYDHEVAA